MRATKNQNAVALRKESVDRNLAPEMSSQEVFRVALRKESVDRNILTITICIAPKVALRKESVDRNIASRQLPTPEPPSLSARRAWIEIRQLTHHLLRYLSLSARRAWIEITRRTCQQGEKQSLSARRAWIEMRTRSQPSKPRRVALRKESVDRNTITVED